MPHRPDLKVVVDNQMSEPPVSPAEESQQNGPVQTILGFAISLPLWGLVAWVVWMWWTGHV